MPRKFRLYRSKNSERRKRQKSTSDQGQVSGSAPSNESNSGRTSGSDLPGPTNESSDHVQSSSCLNESNSETAITSPCPGTEQSVAEKEHDGLHALWSSVSLPDGWSDHSPSNLENVLLC
jgi:hypothetical protein